MPELPEVATVCRELNLWIPTGAVFVGAHFRRKDLRQAFPVRKIKALRGQEFVSVERRAKYLLIHLRRGGFLSHLGMTGEWRRVLGEPGPLGTHDHVILQFQASPPLGLFSLIYRDPRRFGLLDVLPTNNALNHQKLRDLGPEPWSPELDGDGFFQKLKGSSATVKARIMDQSVLVGVGNIYASEALFRAGIRPRRQSSKVKSEEALRLLREIRQTLDEAIRAGGSSIRDYRSALQTEGGFQSQHWVYGHAGEKCRKCNTQIRTTVIAGRSTFWCPRCQQ